MNKRRWVGREEYRVISIALLVIGLIAFTDHHADCCKERGIT